MEISEVVQLAEEAGFGANQRNTLLTKLRLFAEKVASKEREACAQVCIDQGAYRDEIEMAHECARAIRQRSNVELTGAKPVGEASGSAKG